MIYIKAHNNNPDLISLEEALSQGKNKIKKRHENFVNPGLAKMLSLLSFDEKFVRAKGVYVWDENGNKYLDFLGGYGSLNLGHNPDCVIEALERVKEVPNLLQSSLNPLSGALGENLALITPGNLKHTFFCNSGAEAIEGAIKLARRAKNKSKIIYCDGAFHGKSIGALSISGRDKYKEGFGPLLPECYKISYGEENELEKILKEEHEDVAAFILEPIKGEGGIISPEEGYLTQVRKLCSEYDVLLILDEVQTGFGRTGKMFACQYENVTPDVLCLAKSLGGGVMPAGALITTEKIWEDAYGQFEDALLHTSTFGGNSRACAAAISTINEINEKKLWEKAKEKGDYLLSRLNELKKKHALIKEVRGKGLLIGVEFETSGESFFERVSKGAFGKLKEEYTGALIAERLLNEHKIITAYTLNNPNVIRLEPPLVVDKEDIDQVINALDEILQKNSSFFKLATNSTKNLVNNLVKKRL